MARAGSKRSPKSESSAPQLLPLPEAALRHHGQTVFHAMKQWKAQNRVPPVLLITGPSGVGKRSVCHFLSQWLLCERTGFVSHAVSMEDEETPSMFGEMFGASTPESQPAELQAPANHDETLPCGVCSNCQRALNGNWVDFSEISSENEDGESGSLKIEQFRKLKDTVGFGAFDGAFRITLIRDADRMTIQAANSVLKLLEEPPPGWIFFLTASDPSLLLPTIVSRCQTLRLRPFQTQTLEELLKETDIPVDRRPICAELAQGSWNKALTLARDEVWERRANLFFFLEEPHSEINHLVDWASQESSRFDLLLNQLEQITSELIHWSIEHQTHGTSPSSMNWKNRDGKRSLANHASKALKKFGSPEGARAFWTSRAERLFRARQEALAPLNRKLLIQDLLLPWLEI